MNQVKAKFLKIVQSERSDSKDVVRPDKSQICNMISVFIPELLSIFCRGLARYIDVSSQG